MIQFPCRCKHVFELPEDMAGLQIQCPGCLLLVDVPTHEELANLSEDGTIRVEAPSHVVDPNSFEKLRRVYSRTHVDDEGIEIDLRNTPEQIAASGSDDSPPDYEVVPSAPKYDPETGELVRPIEVADGPELPLHPAHIPFAKSAINYAGPDLNPRTSLIAPFVRLLMPINLASMFFVLLAHAFLIMALMSFVLAVFVIFVVGAGIVAHYANVIEEVAIEERDELPRFLRHFNITDDIWLPFCRIGVASILCFWPGMVVRLVGAYKGWPGPEVMVVHLALDFFGLILFPATVLISATSGSLTNLRPDRVLGTIFQIGPKYVFFVVLYIVAMVPYLLGFAAAASQFATLFIRGPSVQWFLAGLLDYSILSIGIFLMHYFAWLLGLSYRSDHDSFPWVLQHHVRAIPGVTAPRYPKMAPANPPHDRNA
ncbi:MAG TPA: hypothetical protein VGG44_12630 [Tepidisphaeraceae bacterium]